MLRAVLLAVLSTSCVASYAGLGLGSSSVDDGADAFIPDGRSGRGIVGFKFRRAALEGAGTVYDVVHKSGAVYSSRSLSAALKLDVPFGNSFEGFLRGGLIHTWLDPTSQDTMPSYRGIGYTASAGIQLRLGDLTTFVDYTRNAVTLGADAETFDQTATMWSLGVTVPL